MIGRWGLLMAAVFLWPGPVARAGEPAAIVEEANAGGLQQMDFLEAGRVVELGQGGTLTLGYLRSCLRESITGGRVTIGVEESKVENGVKKTQQVDCDGGTIVRTKASADVAGAVFRKGEEGQPLPKPDWTSFAISPLLRLSKSVAAIKVERLDKPEAPVTVAAKGQWADFAAAGVRLEPSGLYVISAGDRSSIVKISPLAEAKASLLSRLIPM